jgi:hypothetical protein
MVSSRPGIFNAVNAAQAVASRGVWAETEDAEIKVAQTIAPVSGAGHLTGMSGSCSGSQFALLAVILLRSPGPFAWAGL